MILNGGCLLFWCLGIGLQDIDRNNEKLLLSDILLAISFATIAKLEVGYQISKMTMADEMGNNLLASKMVRSDGC